jgi:pSer/pThr/pTyr-binding forkhead associated (FHA) protein
MAATLVPMEGGSPIALDKPIILIGRNQDCDISLQTSSKISRRHCCIVQCTDRYLLRDLGSMNGVRVNGQRVVEMELKSGDEIAVADVGFTFRLDNGRPKQRSGAAAEGADRVTAPPPADSPPRAGYPVSTPDESDAEQSLRPFEDEGNPENEVRLKDDSESEAGFVRV